MVVIEIIGMAALFVLGLGIGFFGGLRFAGQMMGKRLRAAIDGGRMTREEALRLVERDLEL